jgi:hypothetical protein
MENSKIQYEYTSLFLDPYLKAVSAPLAVYVPPPSIEATIAKINALKHKTGIDPSKVNLDLLLKVLGNDVNLGWKIGKMGADLKFPEEFIQNTYEMLLEMHGMNYKDYSKQGWPEATVNALDQILFVYSKSEIMPKTNIIQEMCWKIPFAWDSPKFSSMLNNKEIVTGG